MVRSATGILMRYDVAGSRGSAVGSAIVVKSVGPVEMWNVY